MAIERRWEAIPEQSVLLDGDTSGFIAVTNPVDFKVKQFVQLKSNSVTTPVKYQVKRVIPTGIYLGLEKSPIDKYADLSQFTVADNTKVYALEQERNSMGPEFVTRAVYQEEPAVALRTIGVDPFGTIVNWAEEGLVPHEFDDVQIIRDDEGDPIEVFFYLRTVLQRHLLIEYDLNKDVVRAYKAPGSP